MKQIRKRLQLILVAAVIICWSCKGAHAQEDITFGSWALGTPAPGHKLATHSTLLRNNKILVVSGSSYNCCYAWGKEDTRFYDIATDTWSDLLNSPAPYGSDKDAFCSGHAHDNSGGIIFQGGLVSYVNNGHGIENAARYDPDTNGWTQSTGAAAHWYPTLVAGVNETFIFPGRNTQPDTVTPEGSCIEKMPYGTTSWTTTGVSLWTKGTYPRVSLLPSGKLFIASPADQDRKNYLFDPGTNTLALAGNDVVPESEPGQLHCCDSWMGTGMLLPFVPDRGTYTQARFALLNGVQAYVKDLGQTNPSWQVMGTRPVELGTPSPTRNFANATLLPTGQVIVTGGISGLGPDYMDADGVKKAEVFDPETNSWLLTSEATVPRNYHGVALLMPDGRVWTASGSQDHSGSQCAGNCTGPEKSEERVEIFTPWYYGRNDRPIMTGCPGIMDTHGTAYDVAIGASQGLDIVRVVLLRAGSVTHAFDTDQRLIQLDILGKTASTVTVASPYIATVAPPGDYMLFALRQVATTGLKRWVPSSACWTRIATPAPPGAPIWRYTGIPCNGDTCPGWQRLDNNPKTISIAASGSPHSEVLYQLHNDGWIWVYTGVPCQADWCPGWQRLDNNSKTIAIAADGSQLYQLHNDGWIWRHTGTPCNGDICPGWQRLDNNSKTIAIAASGGQLYQLHNDGWIWRYAGTPCNGDVCPGWQRLDNNSKTISIAASVGELYQLHNDGWIWRYTGTACNGEVCPGWQRLDNNSKTVAISAAAGQLYQLHNDGWIWRYTGIPCNGDTCPGWERLDNNSESARLAATGTALLQLHVDGSIWRYTSLPCNSNSCRGWQKLDNNPRTGMITASDVTMPGAIDSIYQLHTDPVYQLHTTGVIWRYTGIECDADFCPGWEKLDNNPATDDIVAAGSQLFQHHADGSIWRYAGTPCNGDICASWQMLDNNPNTKTIAAAGNQLFQFHNNGRIWRYTGTPCSGTNCPSWQMLDNNSNTKTIAAGGNQLYQLHNNGRIWRYTGKPCSGTSCASWQMLDNNPNTKAIAAGGNQLFQLHNDGRIWRYTGKPCNGTSCPSWQMLDNNPKTAAITSGGTELYQLHNEGSIWRYTGTPCNGQSCPGWVRLDNNPNTKEIVATGDRLYQRHQNGRIWRYTGPPCTGDSCPGWRMLDDNPNTKHVAAENQSQ
jgi:hypothetical protein